MLFGGKNRQKPDGKQEVKSLYPVLHVAGSLKEYQKDLVQKEVASLWELNLVGDSFSSVLKEADHFQTKLQDLGSSFSNINETAGQFNEVRQAVARSVQDAQGQMEQLAQISAEVQKSYDDCDLRSAAIRHQGNSALHGKNRLHRGSDQYSRHQRLH